MSGWNQASLGQAVSGGDGTVDTTADFAWSGSHTFSSALIANGGVQRSSAGALSVGTDANTTGMTLGRAGMDVTIAGNLVVSGTTVSVNSTTLDVADRVIHVNHSTGADTPAPTAIAGLAVHRGAVAGVDRDHAAIVWDEANSRWAFAWNTGGDDATLGSALAVRTGALTVVGGVSQSGGVVALAGSGGASSLTSTSANLSLSTVTSGDVALSSAGAMTLTAASTISIGATTATDVTLGRAGQTITTHGYIRAVDGAPAAASFGFQNSVATGMRLASLGGGVHQLALQVQNTDIQVMSTLDVTFGVRIMMVPNGNATAPSYTWGGANGNNGFYLSGASQVGLTLGGTQVVNWGRSSNTWTQVASTSGVPVGWTFTAGAHTGITTAQESNSVYFNLSATKTWASTSTVTTQREIRIAAPTYAAATSVNVTTAATVAISGAPTAGANAVIGNAYALWVESGRAQFNGALATGLSSTVGLFGVTPVGRQTAGDAATDLASVITLANNLRTGLIALGPFQA